VPGLRKKAADGLPSQEVYAAQRWTALRAGRGGSLPWNAAHPDVYGVVMDQSQPGGWATFAVLSDDTTDMYTSTGGTVTGAGRHADVAAANQWLLTAAQAHLGHFDTADDGGYPPYGTIRFHLLTGAAGRFADVPETAWRGNKTHPLMPVMGAMQGVITSMRLAAPAPSRPPRR
jgi:hypothetical protein